MGSYLRCVVAGLLICSGASADEALDKAKTRYSAGVEHFNAGRYTEAVKELEAAYALKPVPKFLVEIAKTYRKLDDKTQALRYARQFLRESRVEDADRPAAEHLVKELEPEVVQADVIEKEIPQPMEVPGVEPEEQEPASTAGAGAPTGKKRQRQLTTLLHTPVDEAKVGKGIPVVAELPSGVDATRVFAYYRNAGRGAFARTELKEEGYAFVGQIPASRVIYSSMQYYLEARNAAGKPVALSGNQYNPHIIVVAGGRRPMPERTSAPEPRFRTSTWALAALGGAMFAGGLTFALLARDRESALESAVAASLEDDVRFRWDEEGIRDFESQGRNFATVAKVMFAVGGLAAVGAGAFWFLDYRYTHRRVEIASRLGLMPFGLEGEF